MTSRLGRKQQKMPCAFNIILITILTAVLVNAQNGLKNNLYLNWSSKRGTGQGASATKRQSVSQNIRKNKNAPNYRRLDNNTNPINATGHSLQFNDTVTEDNNHLLQVIVKDWIEQAAQVLRSVRNDTVRAREEFTLDFSGDVIMKTTTYQTPELDKIGQIIDGLQPKAKMSDETLVKNNTLTYQQARQEYQEGKRTNERPDPKVMEQAVKQWIKDMGNVMFKTDKLMRSKVGEDSNHKRKPSVATSPHNRIDISLSGEPRNYTLEDDIKQIKATIDPKLFRQGIVVTETPIQDITTPVASVEALIPEDPIFDYGGDTIDLIATTTNGGNDYGPAFTPDLKSVADALTSTVTVTESAATIHPIIAAAIKHREERKIGIFSAFVAQFFLIIANKADEDVKKLVQALELVITDLERAGKLADLDRPFLPALMYVLQISSGMPGDYVKGQALTAYNLLENRNETVSTDIDSIMNSIDSLYSDSEGEQLFESLITVDEYPGNQLTHVQVMTKVIEDALLSPYRRLSGTDQRRNVINKINQAISVRFPMIPYRRADNIFKYYNGYDRKAQIDQIKAAAREYLLRNIHINKIKRKFNEMKEQHVKNDNGYGRISRIDKMKAAAREYIRRNLNNNKAKRIFDKMTEHHDDNEHSYGRKSKIDELKAAAIEYFRRNHHIKKGKRKGQVTGKVRASEKHSNKLQHKRSHKHSEQDKKQMKLQKVVDHLRDKHPKTYKKYIKHLKRKHGENKSIHHKRDHSLEGTDQNYEKLLNDRNEDIKSFSNVETEDDSNTNLETTDKAIPKVTKNLKKIFKTPTGKRTVKKKYTTRIKSSQNTNNQIMKTTKRHRTMSFDDNIFNNWMTTPKRNVPLTKGSIKYKMFNENPYAPFKVRQMQNKATKETVSRVDTDKYSDSVEKRNDLNLFDMRRFNEVKRKNKINELSSYSGDEEVVLKSNIYKAFGYNKDVEVSK